MNNSAGSRLFCQHSTKFSNNPKVACLCLGTLGTVFLRILGTPSMKLPITVNKGGLNIIIKIF